MIRGEWYNVPCMRMARLLYHHLYLHVVGSINRLME